MISDSFLFFKKSLKWPYNSCIRLQSINHLIASNRGSLWLARLFLLSILERYFGLLGLFGLGVVLTYCFMYSRCPFSLPYSRKGLEMITSLRSTLTNPIVIFELVFSFQHANEILPFFYSESQYLTTSHLPH